MNIHNLFEDALHRAAARPALIAGIGKKRRTVTFEQLDQYVDGVVADAHDNSAPSDDEDEDDDEERPGTAEFMLPATGEGILDDDEVFDADE